MTILQELFAWVFLLMITSDISFSLKCLFLPTCHSNKIKNISMFMLAYWMCNVNKSVRVKHYLILLTQNL